MVFPRIPGRYARGVLEELDPDPEAQVEDGQMAMMDCLDHPNGL